MLNALKLSELLVKNTDPKLYPRFFVMSPNGTLMAYTTPVDIRDLRDQAALISMAWKDHSTPAKPHPATGPDSPTTTTTTASPLETLTIETANNNIIARAIQPSLLLVLVGSVPPTRKPVFKITPEAKGDPRYPAIDAVPSDEASLPASPTALPDGEEGAAAATKQTTPSILSTMSQRDRDVKGGVLHIQRKKIDALTEFIRADFDAQGFVMPDDSSFP